MVESYIDFESVFKLLDGMVLMPNTSLNVDEFRFELTIPENSITVMNLALFYNNRITMNFEFTWLEYNSVSNLIKFCCGPDIKLITFLCKSTVKKRNEKINEIVNGQDW